MNVGVKAGPRDLWMRFCTADVNGNSLRGFTTVLRAASTEPMSSESATSVLPNLPCVFHLRLRVKYSKSFLVWCFLLTS